MGGKPWTAKEDRLLSELWGTYSVDKISERLERSKAAISNRKDKLKLGRFYESGSYITLNALYKALRDVNVNTYQVKSWISNRGLPVRNRVRNNGYKVRCIYLEDFWTWAEQHKNFIDFSLLKRNSLGQEPAWVAEQRRFDELKHISVTTAPWSHADDEKLQAMLRLHKFNTTQIAQRLCRTEGAVVRRIVTLGLKLKPRRNSPHIPWTADELALLDNLLRSGANYTVIASQITRHSEKAIRGMTFRIYNTENLDKIRQLIAQRSESQ